MKTVHIAECACGYVGAADGGTKIVNYFCPQCGTGKYLVTIGDYVLASEANERIKVLEDALNRYVTKFGNCGEVYYQAVAALEVKP
jgi:hypothetical protein